MVDEGKKPAVLIVGGLGNLFFPCSSVFLVGLADLEVPWLQ